MKLTHRVCFCVFSKKNLEKYFLELTMKILGLRVEAEKPHAHTLRELLIMTIPSEICEGQPK